MEKEVIQKETENTNPPEPEKIEVTKESIVLTAKAIYGGDIHCLWTKGTYKKNTGLKIIIPAENMDYSVEIDSLGIDKNFQLDYIARTLITLHGRARAMLLHEMAAGMAQREGVKKDEANTAVEKERDRMLGRTGE